MADKEVKIKVGTDVELSKVQALEDNINKIKLQKIQLDIQTNTARLEDVNSKIESTKSKLQTLHGKADVDDSEVKQLETELERLEADKLNIQLDIETSKLDAAKSKLDSIDDEPIKPQVDNISAMDAIGQIADGITRVKQGASELKQNMDEVAQAGIQSEQNKAFLEMNLGAEKARDTYQDISDIVASMPGDDNTMRSVLSTAQALGNNLNPDEMKAAAGTMADYMSGSATMGKQALESQQDIMKYLLDGNTAELEKGSIVSSQVDKLKEATTFQERQAAMQQVLNDLGYGGIANMDTTLKKQMEWEGMIYNSQDALSSMWLGAEKGAMDYILKLNDASDGLVGMGIVAAQMVTGPFVDIMSGIGQIGVGFKSLKEVADFTGITEKLGGLKTAIMNVGTVAKDAALKMLELGKQALMAGLNALKSVAMWTAQKLAVVASTLAEWGLAAAQAFLNLVMSMNPIMLIVIALVALAAALIWAYYNVDWFRQMVDGAWQSLVQLGQQLYGIVAGAIQWVMSLFQQFTSQLGLNTQDWIQAIIGFILFIPQLPLRLGIALANAIARALGFKGNFVESLISAASNAVSGFVNYITQLPGIVMGEFNRVLGLVNDFINSLPDRVWDMGQAIIDALKRSLGIGSPGHMFYMMEGELERLEDLPGDMEDGITRNVRYLGEGIVDSFNPNLNSGTLNGEIANGSYGGQVNFYFSDITVDNDDRMEKIYDYITRRLHWDNKTAGRSV